MDIATYAAENAIEQTHWWFLVRRRLFAKLIGAYHLPRDARILDAGTSTGTNLRLLRDLGFTNYTGLDMSEEAIRWCAQKGLGTVQKGDICAMPFAGDTFDFIIASDIIEHVPDDAGALRELRRVLKPGGHILLTVPAFQSLWGLQDEVSQHQRRYRLPQLRQRLQEAGFGIDRITYFNYLLFVPIWLARQAIRIFKPKVSSENEVNNPFINRILHAIFSLDVASLSFIRPPFGVSILALLRKTA